jgi:polygalacturonase
MNWRARSRTVLACGIAAAVWAGAGGTVVAADPWAEAAAIRARIHPPVFPDHDVQVVDHGAKGDGITDCRPAFARAIAACHEAGGGRVVVPAGDYLVNGPIHLLSGVNLHLARGATVRFGTDPADYLPPVFTRWEGTECMNYSPFVYAFGQENIGLTGEGTLDGQGHNDTWWSWCGSSRFGWKEGMPRQNESRLRLMAWGEAGVPPEQRVLGDGAYMRPNMIQPYLCTNVLIAGVTIRNSAMWHVHPVRSQNVTVRGVTVVGHGPNNDGCNPESCKDVLIEDCAFDTGDDCIAIKSGRNADGRRVNVPSENIVVRGCRMKDGHGGVVMGSEMSGSVRNVFVESCTMDSPNLDRALRIKSNSFRGGTVENVHMRNVQIGEVREAVLKVNFYYENGDGGAFTPTVRQISMQDVTCERSGYGILLTGLDRAPIQDVSLERCVFEDVDEPLAVVGVNNLLLRDVRIAGKRYDLKTDVRLPQAVKAALAGEVTEPCIVRRLTVAGGLPPTRYEFRVDDADGGRRIRISSEGQVVEVKR